MNSITVSLRVPREQFDVEAELELDGVIGIVGASGSGKSTVLRALAGLEPAATGAPCLDAGYLGQVDGLFPHLSARDNVVYVLRAAGAPKAAAREVATLLLAELDLSDLSGTMPGHLSGGQRRRVALARALAARRGIYLLDEPFAGLDEDAADAAARFIAARLLDHDKPALIAGHDIDRLDRICGRIESIEAGRLTGSKSLSDEVAPRRAQAPAATRRNTGDRRWGYPGDSR